MSTFYILATVMVVMAMLIVGWPLIRTFGETENASRKNNLVGGLIIMLAIPAGAAWFYGDVSTWDWNQSGATRAPEQAEPHDTSMGNLGEMAVKLEARLNSEGGNVGDWMLLGRTYLRSGNTPKGMAAFEKGMALGGENDASALVQYGQALVELDESSISGRAGELFEKALALSPDEPASLWWSGFAALAADRLPEARARWSKLLTLNPPENIVTILTEQIAKIDQTLGGTPAPAVATAAAEPVVAKPAPKATQENIPEGTIALHISVDPQLDISGLQSPAAVFIIARQAGVPGPPIAVIRKTTADLPATIMLSDANAMIAGTTITGIEQLQLIARVSLSGRPIAAPGDLYGQVDYRWEDGNSVDLVIDTLTR
jgi:cytochrome c-type biogenesis protein CcmH